MSSASRFIPLLNRVLVQKIKPATKTTSGIILPQAKTTLSQATVIAVNQGYPNAQGVMINPVLKVGDNVLLPEFGGSEVKIDGEAYHIFREDDIMGVINE